MFLIAESVNVDFNPLSKDNANDLYKEYFKEFPFLKKVIVNTSQTSNYGFSLYDNSYYLIPVKFEKVLDNDDLNKQYFDKVIKSDHIFMLFSYEKDKLNVAGYLCLNTSIGAGVPEKTRTIRVVQLIDRSKDSYMLKIFAEFIMNKLTISAKGVGINPDTSLVSIDFYLYMSKHYGFEKSPNSNWLVKGLGQSTNKQVKVSAPKNNEKKAPDGGTRDWEQKSSGRRDGMPGGNQGKDYVRKGDHGQAGLDNMFKAFDKAGDYIFNKEASKKYRV